jgi:FAD/FMN-containing dehydrogenase
MTEVTASNTSPLDPGILASYQRRMRGELFVPSPDAHDQPPALIARCLHARDVALAISLARDWGMEIVAWTGEHNVAGDRVSAGDMLIDLSEMRQIVVDPLQQIARVESGATNGEFAQAAAAYGLAISDNVLAVEVVTAEGALITVSVSEHADLFQAFRDGSNIGVITAMTYQVGPLFR